MRKNYYLNQDYCFSICVSSPNLFWLFHIFANLFLIMQTHNLMKITKHRKCLFLMMWKIAFCLYLLSNSLCKFPSACLGRCICPSGCAITCSADRFVLQQHGAAIYRRDLFCFAGSVWKMQFMDCLTLRSFELNNSPEIQLQAEHNLLLA